MVRKFNRLQCRALLVVATLCAALSGCGADEQSVGGPNKPAHTVESLSPGQIGSVLASINQGEVTQAQIALARLIDEPVRAYAEKLVAEHQTANTELDAILNRLGTKQESSAMKTDLEQLAQKLNRVIAEETADGLASTFLSVQIRMHKRGLTTVEQLLSQAQQPELRTYLENLRTSLQQHLEDAVQLHRRFPGMESSL